MSQCHALTLLALAAPLCAEFKFNPLRLYGYAW